MEIRLYRFRTFLSLDLKAVMSYYIQKIKLMKVKTGRAFFGHCPLVHFHGLYLSVPACTYEGILLRGHSYFCFLVWAGQFGV